MKENNKLIAEFMGFPKARVYSYKGKPYDYVIPGEFELIKEVETSIESTWCEVLEEQDHCMIEDLKFHSSWDWLMPVVQKLESTRIKLPVLQYNGVEENTTHMFLFRIELTGCGVQVYEEGSATVFKEMWVVRGNKLYSVYMAVVSAIKFYNKWKH